DVAARIELRPRPDIAGTKRALPLLGARRAPVSLNARSAPRNKRGFPLLLPIRIEECLFAIQCIAPIRSESGTPRRILFMALAHIPNFRRRGSRIAALQYPRFIEFNVHSRIALRCHDVDHAIRSLRGGCITDRGNPRQLSLLPRDSIVIAKRNKRAGARWPQLLLVEQIRNKKQTARLQPDHARPLSAAQRFKRRRRFRPCLSTIAADRL